MLILPRVEQSAGALWNDIYKDCVVIQCFRLGGRLERKETHFGAIVVPGIIYQTHMHVLVRPSANPPNRLCVSFEPEGIVSKLLGLDREEPTTRVQISPGSHVIIRKTLESMRPSVR